MTAQEEQAILTAATGAVSLLQALAPTLQAIAATGNISDSQQASVKAINDALRGPLSGPEWQLSR